MGDGCFTSGQAHLLPQKIWSCTNDVLAAAEDTTAELADGASSEVGKPIVECHYDNEAKCVVHPNCEWCKTTSKVRLLRTPSGADLRNHAQHSSHCCAKQPT